MLLQVKAYFLSNLEKARGDMEALIRDYDMQPNEKNKEKKFLKKIEIAESKIPITIGVDMGRFLGFHRQPKSQSWDWAGKSYQMGQFW